MSDRIPYNNDVSLWTNWLFSVANSSLQVFDGCVYARIAQGPFAKEPKAVFRSNAEAIGFLKRCHWLEWDGKLLTPYQFGMLDCVEEAQLCKVGDDWHVYFRIAGVMETKPRWIQPDPKFLTELLTLAGKWTEDEREGFYRPPSRSSSAPLKGRITADVDAYSKLKSVPERANWLLKQKFKARSDIDAETLSLKWTVYVGAIQIPVKVAPDATPEDAIEAAKEWLRGKANEAQEDSSTASQEKEGS